jgi:hypothetical protein
MLVGMAKSVKTDETAPAAITVNSKPADTFDAAARCVDAPGPASVG